MPSLPKLFSIVESLPAEAQERITEALARAVEQESQRLEEQALQLRKAINGAASGKKAPRKSRGGAVTAVRRKRGKKQRLTEADYEAIRSEVSGSLEKNREYPQPELFAIARKLGHDVKKATFTKKVLDPLCEAGALVWNEQRRGSAYKAA